MKTLTCSLLLLVASMGPALAAPPAAELPVAHLQDRCATLREQLTVAWKDARAASEALEAYLASDARWAEDGEARVEALRATLDARKAEILALRSELVAHTDALKAVRVAARRGGATVASTDR